MVESVGVIVDVDLTVLAVTMNLRTVLFRPVVPGLYPQRDSQNGYQTVCGEDTICDAFSQRRGLALLVLTQI